METCIYEIHINSFSICSIPHFSKKPNNFDILCSPVVKSEIYEKYLKNQQKLDLDHELKESSINFVPQSEIKEQDENKVLNDLIEDEMSKFDSIDKEIRTELVEGEHTVSNLIENAKNFKNTLQDMKVSPQFENLEDIEDVNEFLRSTADQLLKTDELIEKIASKLNTLVDELESEDDLSLEGNAIKEEKAGNRLKNPNSLEQRVANRFDDAEVLDVSDEKNLKQLEKEISDKLASSAKLSNKLKEKLGKNKIQFKIIKFDSSHANLNSLNEFESSGLNSLLNSLYDTDKQLEKIKNLKSNYDLVYDENFVDNLSVEQNQNENKIEKYQKNFLNHFDDFYLDQEEEDKLIIY